MSENGTHQNLTIDEWSVHIRKTEMKGDAGAFRFLTRQIFSSDAYIALTLIEREVLLCFLNKLRYEPVSSREKRKGRKAAWVPVNARDLTVTYNEVKARRIVALSNDKSISNAKKRLIEVGFLDVVKPAQFPHAGIYALSDRWRRFPAGDYRPKTDVPCSFPAYANIDANHNRKRRTEKLND